MTLVIGCMLCPSTTVYNVISLEYSETALAQYVIAPAVVRRMDWIDLYWPKDRRITNKQYPQVSTAVHVPVVVEELASRLLHDRLCVLGHEKPL